MKNSTTQKKEITNQLQLNFLTGHIYQGDNQLILQEEYRNKNYMGNTWGTYLMWNQEGYKIKKGEKSTPIHRYVSVITGTKDNGEHIYKNVVKYHYLFNSHQVEQIEEN